MAELAFENLRFEELKTSEGDIIRIRLLQLFYFDTPREAFEKIGKLSVRSNSLEFTDASEKRVSIKFTKILSDGLQRLRNSLNNRPAVYVHKNSGIPLIGTLFMGIVDRGTSAIEIKPITGCNMGCMFCSVDEGLDSRKGNDFVIEEEYLVQETRKLLDFRASKGMKSKSDIFINPHGEPLLYADLDKLIKDLKALERVGNISLITNGTLLSKERIDSLAEAGLDSLNISVSSLDQKTAQELEGSKAYDVSRVRAAIDYASGKKNLKIIIAPVWLKGKNDSDIEEIIEYAKQHQCGLGIQKFIEHKKGRKPKGVRDVGWGEFQQWLKMLEKKHAVHLVVANHPGAATDKAEKVPQLPSPFRKEEVITATVVAQGRSKNERIAAAKERSMIVYACTSPVGTVIKARIINAKDNTFVAETL